MSTNVLTTLQAYAKTYQTGRLKYFSDGLTNLCRQLKTSSLHFDKA